MKVIVLVVLLSAASIQQCESQVKHPQEMDLSDLEDDIELMNWTERKLNRINDCDIFYRRLVKNLFNKERFHPDPTSNYYIANVPLRLKREQWQLLVDLNIDGLNSNEIDDLIGEVLRQSYEEDWVNQAAQILLDHYKHQLIESLPSINSPIVMIAITILIIFVVNRIFHISKLTFSAIFFLLILGICAVSYAMMYWDCLSDLEVEQIIQLSKKQSANNPCKDYDGEYSNVWSSFKATVFGSSENACLEHMRRTLKASKNYCDPLDVFAKWFGKIQMSYFSSIIGGFLEQMSILTSSHNFLSKIILWVVGTIALLLLIFNFGKEVIVHGCKGLFNAVTNTRISIEQDRNSTSDYHRLHSKMEEILEENQQMKRELSTIIRECSVERSRSSPPRIKDVPSLSNIDEETF